MIKLISIILFVILIVPIESYSFIISYDQNTSTISTTGTFGSGVAPEIWENFEDGDSGDQVTLNRSPSQAGEWSAYVAGSAQGAEYPLYSDQINKNGSTLNSSHHMVTEEGVSASSDSILKYWLLSPVTSNGDKFYCSFWTQFDWGTSADGDRQQKYIFISKEWSLSSLPALRFNPELRSATADVYTAFTYTSATSGLVGQLQFGSTNPFPVNPGWVQVQIWFLGHTSAGEWHIRIVNDSENQQQDFSGVTLEAGESLSVFQWGLGAANVDNGDLDTKFRFDDIMLIKGWSRVAIGNNINYEDATHIEQQIVTDWDTNITIAENKGSMTTGITYYMWVIDNDDLVSDQDEVTEGSQGLPFTFVSPPTGSGTVTINPTANPTSISYGAVEPWTVGN